jgi:hypothetical protein
MGAALGGYYQPRDAPMHLAGGGAYLEESLNRSQASRLPVGHFPQRNIKWQGCIRGSGTCLSLRGCPARTSPGRSASGYEEAPLDTAKRDRLR